MRLSQYAKQMNVSYKTAFRWWRAGRFDAYQLDTGTIIVRDPLPETNAPKGIALYARVSTQGQKADLDRQVERLKLDTPIRVCDDGIQLPKLGTIRLKEHSYIPTSGVKVLSATVSERAGRWYVSVLVEEQVPL